jgi:regulator of sigma E protease
VTVLLALLAVSAMLLFHELGHAISARAFGIRVERFSIGIGPEIVGFHDRFKTRWSLSCVPFAGRVRFYRSQLATNSVTPLGVRYEDSKPMVRLGVVVAGPIFSVAFAYLLGTACCYWDYNDKAPTAGSATSGGPADRAGVTKNDRILSINGRKVFSFIDIQEAVQDASTDELHVTIERDGSNIDLLIRPESTDFQGENGCTGQRQSIGLKAGEEGYSPSLLAAAQISARQVQNLASAVINSLIHPECGFGRNVRVRTHASAINAVWALSLGYALANFFPLPYFDGAEMAFCVAALVRGRPLRHRFRDRLLLMATVGIWAFMLLKSVL